MTLFDLVGGLVLLASAMIGFARGAVRELIGFFSFLIAALAAVWLLPIGTAFMTPIFHTHWMAVAGSIIASFVIVYVVLRLIGNAITGGLQNAGLGGFNKAGGLLVGIARGFLSLGVVAILVGLLPAPLQPGWILDAKLWPISRYSGQLIKTLIPKGDDLTGGFGDMFKNAMDKANTGLDTNTDATPQAPSDAAPRRHSHRARESGYDDHSRDRLDSLVDRSR